MENRVHYRSIQRIMLGFLQDQVGSLSVLLPTDGPVRDVLSESPAPFDPDTPRKLPRKGLPSTRKSKPRTLEVSPLLPPIHTPVLERERGTEEGSEWGTRRERRSVKDLITGVVLKKVSFCWFGL